MDNYASYLPHINAEEGIKRIMNNKKLYVSMLTRFKLDEMTAALLEAISSNDAEKIVFAAHALKGAAGNLGLPTLQELTGVMEQAAKDAAKEGNNVLAVYNVEGLVALVGELKPLLARFVQDEA